MPLTHGNTVATTSTTVVVTPTGPTHDVVLQAGTSDGQVVIVINTGSRSAEV